MSVFKKINKSLKTFVSEYKQVRWPSLETTINLTLFVIIVSSILMLIILGVDTFFFEFRSRFIFS